MEKLQCSSLSYMSEDILKGIKILDIVGTNAKAVSLPDFPMPWQIVNN